MRAKKLDPTFTPHGIFSSGSEKIKSGNFQDFKWLTRSLVTLSITVSAQTRKIQALETRLRLLEKAIASKEGVLNI